MDAAQRRRWLITAGLAVLVVAAIVLYYRSTDPGAPEQRFFKVNTVDTAALECPGNDLIFISQSQIVQTSGLPTTASRAIQEQVTTTYRGIPPSELEQVQSSATAATYRFESNAGDVLAQVELLNTGGGWAVDSFVACDSFLEDQV